MSYPEHEPHASPHEKDSIVFADTYKKLLPGVEFEESSEMREARIAVLEALTKSNQNPDFLGLFG
jgi:hypothetical protein